MNEELRRRIEERRDEHEAIAARPGGGDNCQAYANALSWVLDLLDAQPAAVSLPEEAEPAGICGWRLTEWDRCTRPADHEGACA